MSVLTHCNRCGAQFLRADRSTRYLCGGCRLTANEYRRKRYAALLAAGLCTRCKARVERGAARCGPCLEYLALHTRKAAAMRREALWDLVYDLVPDDGGKS